MNLTLSTSHAFRLRAVNLAESYFKSMPGGRVIFCHFGGDISELFCSRLAERYKERMIILEVEKTCDHAHDPRLYFFKTFAIRCGMLLREPFLYLDSGASIVRRPIELLSVLYNKTRFIVQYPPVVALSNGKWTSRRCLEKLGLNTEPFRVAPQYMAGLQAYLPTDENIHHVEEMFDLMHDPEIAGPSNLLFLPDGAGGCQFHRNDQSLLSLLMQRNGWSQPYEDNIFAMYGDGATTSRLAPEYHSRISAIKGTQGVSIRHGRLDSLTKADIEYFDV